MLFLCHFYVLHPQQNPEKPADAYPSVHITIDNRSEARSGQRNQFNQESTHSSALSTNVSVSGVDSSLERLSELYGHYQTKFKNSTINFLGWMSKNKIKSLSLFLTSLYGFVSYQIYSRNQIINDCGAWSNWYNGKSLEALFDIPQNKLEAELLFMIQNRYVHPTNPTDFIYSIVQSSSSINTEISVLQDQVNLYEWIAKCKLLELFFIEESSVKQLQEKHKKLLFMKHIFMSWCANYKIEQNNS